MRIPGLAAEYVRTCADCGSAWRVPRAFAHRFQSISTAIVENNLRARPVGGLDPQLMPQSSRPDNDQREAFRHCPECGSERYTQRQARN